jgi:16S rRNA (guanine966-N2)-methyltransferase
VTAQWVCPNSGSDRYGGTVRVIGGQSRGRRLIGRLPDTVRPTSDRVREAIFDMLGSRGGVEDLQVTDLFCGSGAFGVEALSRGAAHVTFVDEDAAALAAVKTNLEAVGLGLGAASLVRATLPGWLARAPRVDVVFCDPPYIFDQWATLLGEVRAELAVLESNQVIDAPSGWMTAKTRRYGGTLVTVMHSDSLTPEVLRP